MVMSFLPVLKDQAFYNNAGMNCLMLPLAQHSAGNHRNLTEHLTHWAPLFLLNK